MSINNFYIPIGIVAGLIVGFFNSFLLKYCARKASSLKKPGRSALFLIAGYLGRYALIVAAVLLIAKYYGLPLALLFLAGLMVATIVSVPFKPKFTMTDKTGPAPTATDANQMK